MYRLRIAYYPSYAYPLANISVTSLESPLPVTLLTGFLGRGKTTVLNHLVRTLPRTAILMNEFGVDHQLLEKMDGPIALLSGGCVCCTITGSLSSKHVMNLQG